MVFLTDHDTISGFPEALEAAREAGVDLRCGIEINTVDRDNVHVLGYGVNWDSPGFRERLGEFRRRRRGRIGRIVDNLKACGVEITLDEVLSVWREQAGRGSEADEGLRRAREEEAALGRPHVADALRRKKIVQSRQEAFNRFLAKGKPGYVESAGPSPQEAIAMIRDAGGFCSLAHPQTVGELKRVEEWARLGLEGLEAYYSSHGPSDTARFLTLAQAHGLLATGGTDFHGPGSGREKPLGVEVPDEVYGRFMERLARCG